LTKKDSFSGISITGETDISENYCRIINSNMEGTQQESNLQRLALIKQFIDKGNILEDFS
jgi:hypothetical protein